MPAVSSRHIANSRSRPTLRTVLTDVWTITGERCSTAAASTASMLRSLTTFIAATPYRSANARSTISFIETTGTRTSLRQQGESTCGCHGSGSVKTPVSPGDFPYLPALPGPRPPGEFRAVARARLAQHGAGVFLHRLDRQHQPLGDELVGEPLLHQAAHLAFPAGQGRLEVVGAQAAVQLGEHGPGQDGLAAAGRHHAAGEFRPVGADAHTAARAGPHRVGHPPLVPPPAPPPPPRPRPRTAPPRPGRDRDQAGRPPPRGRGRPGRRPRPPDRRRLAGQDRPGPRQAAASGRRPAPAPRWRP